MAIVPEAARDEMSSPFYKQNMDICLNWERLIEKYNGVSRGKFNAWAYRINGQFKTDFTWQVSISKASYSSTGIASFRKNWNVFENLELKTKIYKSGLLDFSIRKKRFFDSFKSKTTCIRINRQYNLIGGQINHPLIQFIISNLSEPMQTKNLYKVSFKENELSISIHYYNKGYELVKKIFELKESEI